jgi:hypothetical protein
MSEVVFAQATNRSMSNSAVMGKSVACLVVYLITFCQMHKLDEHYVAIESPLTDFTSTIVPVYWTSMNRNAYNLSVLLKNCFLLITSVKLFILNNHLFPINLKEVIRHPVDRDGHVFKGSNPFVSVEQWNGGVVFCSGHWICYDFTVLCCPVWVETLQWTETRPRVSCDKSNHPRVSELIFKPTEHRTRENMNRH